MKYLLLFLPWCLLIAMGWYLLDRAEKEQKILTQIADCVHAMQEADDYHGTDKDAWDIYAPTCVRLITEK